jgi:hypothetical protein
MDLKEWCDLTYEEQLKVASADEKRRQLRKFEESLWETEFDLPRPPEKVPAVAARAPTKVQEYRPVSYARGFKSYKLPKDWRQRQADLKAKAAKADQGPKQWELRSKVVSIKIEKDADPEDAFDEEDRCFAIAAREAEKREQAWKIYEETKDWEITEDDEFEVPV